MLVWESVTEYMGSILKSDSAASSLHQTKAIEAWITHRFKKDVQYLLV